MRADQGRSIGRRWVAEVAASLPGFRGALWHGSIVEMPDAAEMAASSDIDIVVVVDDPAIQPALGKIVRDGVLLDVSFASWDEVRDTEALLADHSLAPTFRNPKVLSDPDGVLAGIVSVVGAAFPARVRVEQRCASALARIERNLASLDARRPFHENVMAWLFGTGVTTHVVLVAGLRNPTVRKRYLAVRELLVDVEMGTVYPELLDLLGCRDWTPAMATRHLEALAEAFDVVGSVLRTPVFFANDLAPAARSIAIGGSRELIAAGNHREAVFWIVATWARCMTVFHNDAPEQAERFAPGFLAALRDLGITSFDDLQRRGDVVTRYLPRLRIVARAVMDATPAIRG